MEYQYLIGLRLVSLSNQASADGPCRQRGGGSLSVKE